MRKRLEILSVFIIAVVIAAGLAGCGNSSGASNIPVMIYEAYTAGGYFSDTNYAPYYNNYIVLYNASAEPVNIDGWMLGACSSLGEIMTERSAKLSGVIQPGGFFIIEGGQATDAFERAIGEPLPFDVDLFAPSFVPERKDGIIVLCVKGKSGKISAADKDVVDYLAYGNAQATGGNAANPTVKSVLRRISFTNTKDNRQDFRTVNIVDRPANIIQYIAGMTADSLLVRIDQSGATVSLSHSAGVYGREFGLEITTTLQGDAKIYYTLDGSAPISATGTISPTAQEYVGPISIRDRTSDMSLQMPITGTVASDFMFQWPPARNQGESESSYQQRLDSLYTSVYKGNVVRAAAVNGDKVVTPTVTASYFVTEKSFAARYNMPVISILTDMDGLYNAETGIFMLDNLEDREETGRVPAIMQYFEMDGTLAFTEEIRFQLNGGFTRQYPQKSFRVYTSSNNFAYDLFDGYAKDINGGIITFFDRFILRSGGNDQPWGGLRDTFWQRYCSQLGTFDYQASRPVTLFLNGDYWGTYFITERQDDHYISSHYGIPRSDVAMVESFSSLREGVSGDQLEVYNLREFIINNDMTVPENYKRFTDMIDIESYIDLFICQIISGNTDWPHNNIRMWKNRNPNATENTKWKMIMCDVDWAFHTNYDISFNFLNDLLYENEGREYRENAIMFSALMTNSEFKAQFISRAEFLLDTFFDPDAIIKSYLELREEVTPAFAEQQPRWDMGIDRWNKTPDIINQFVPARINVFREELQRLKEA